MLQDLVSLIFPEVCASCQEPITRGETILCSRCILDLPFIDQGSLEMQRKFSAVENLMYARAYLRFSKSGMTQRLLHQLKYDNRKEIGLTLGRWFGQSLQSGDPMPIDLLLPVPLHLSKKKKRGYNQSDLIAEGLAQSLGVEWNSKVICRRIPSDSQTRKGKVERWKNVADVFEVTDPAALQGKKVVMVDDVVTTGATLNHCLEAINQYEVAAVGVLSLGLAH